MPLKSKSKSYQRVIKARSDMLVGQPFFGFLSMRLVVIEDPACLGIWTDGTTLGFNPNVVELLKDVELQGFICDAIMGIVAGHPWRRDSRKQELWNLASSHVTKMMVHDAGFRLPSFMPVDERFKGFSAEYVYAQMLDEALENESQSEDASKEGSKGAEGSGAGESSGKGSLGSEKGAKEPAKALTEDDESLQTHLVSEVRPAPDDSKEHSWSQWQMAMSSAASIPGMMPGGMKSEVSKALASAVDWRSVLQNFVESASAPDDYSYSRPNSRYLHMGLYMPTLQSEQVPSIVFVRDTSGSIGHAYREICYSALSGVLSQVSPQELVILDVDAQVQRAQHLTSMEFDSFDTTVVGGGGTRFEPAFEYIEKQGIECSCLIYLTDLQGSFPIEAPDYPVLWAVPEGSNRGINPPFGELLELEVF